MNRCLLVLTTVFFSYHLFSQLGNGSPAPDIDVVDINGNSYNLYSMMGSNKSACLDFSATWCSPCWAFHQSGVLQNVTNNLSAYTTVLFIEGDWTTNTACLYGPSGCNNGTQGDWVTGSPYQIADLSSSNGPTVDNDYAISYYPTLYVISPDKRTWEIQDRSYQNYVNWITKSFALAATATLTNSPCGDNGKITLNVTGGFSTLAYKWSNGATTKDLTNLPGGTYAVTITDVNTYYKEYGPFVITGPTKRVDVTSVNIVNAKCYNEATGSIGISVDYGTSPYSYNWSNGNKTNVADDLKAGAYSVTITDFNGCTRVKSYTVTQPADLIASASSGKDNCNNIDGYVQVKASGGVAPYLYDIGFGDQQSSYFSDLRGGRDYTVTITDSHSCYESVNIYVDVTNKPKVEAGTDKPLDCRKEIINLDGTQSDQGSHYTYLWTTKDGNIVKGAETLIPDVNKPGKYNLKITDVDNKCFDVDSVYVLDKRVFPDIQASRDTILNCVFIETTAKGNSNNPATKFYWKKVNDTAYLVNGKSIVVNDSGKFILHVKDTINLCIARDTVIIKKDQQKPDAVAKADKDVSCINTEINIDGSQSSKGSRYIYDWSTANGNIVSGTTSLTPLVNKGGDYSLLVTDTINQCNNSTSVSVAEQTQPKADFTQSSNGLNVLFNDNSEGVPKVWHWDFGDGTLSSDKNPQHTYLSKGQYKVCLVINNDCGIDSICQSLTIGNSISLTCPSMQVEVGCQSQSAINNKFATWLTTASFTGGCNPALSNDNTGAPSACGGSKIVTFTVTSTCDPTVTCQAQFVVVSSPAVVLTCASNITEAACQTQAAINQKFANWLSTATFSGGCDASISNDNKGAPSACGGTTTVTFSVTSSCSATKTCSATFTVQNSKTVILNCPLYHTEEAGQTQAQIDAKYGTWLTTVSFSGGCNAAISNNDTGAPPNTGGTVTVTFLVTSSCDVPKTCSATFVVKDLVASNNPISVKQFELIPNPAGDNGYINIELDKQQSFTLSMMNVVGKKVWSNNYDTEKQSIPVDLKNITKGLYFVELKTANAKKVLKWIVD